MQFLLSLDCNKRIEDIRRIEVRRDLEARDVGGDVGEQRSEKRDFEELVKGD